MKNLEAILEISQEVQASLEGGGPVVALESSIIANGMPYPNNLETALACERAIRQEGCVPATIGFLDGKLKIGMSEHEIEQLATPSKAQKLKISSRDIPIAIAGKQSGGTTVAATIIGAEIAKIQVFATGGIGGVHRGGEDSMDVSADLYELARSNVCVVCAGVKAILDIGRTLELLESLGVPVVGYETKEFPGFYTRESGFFVSASLDAQSIAKALLVKKELSLVGGMVVAVKPPSRSALQKEVVDKWIVKALEKAKDQGVQGKDVTPFLLQELTDLSQGQTLVANQDLVENNALHAARIARSLALQSH